LVVPRERWISGRFSLVNLTPFDALVFPIPLKLNCGFKEKARFVPGLNQSSVYDFA
jgi:hypothetical protein